ncbi:MAG: NAD-dependent epimerase/dehydratase family protein [Candidatus Bathyarchaeota archaeon]|nr:NAD-dependent epimerase/dehydratase family protein [Candidatus Bathyarchaeota archaeon]
MKPLIALKIGVTGGAGYVGSKLVKSLIAGKNKVVSIDNLMNGDYGPLRTQGAGDEANLLEGDIRDLEFMVEAFEGCDAIAHLAALPGLVKCRERPDEATSINVYGTYNVLEAARRLGIGKVVFCSTAAVYGKPAEMPVTEGVPLRPLNLYGVTKLAGERLMDVFSDNHGIATISLRFGNVFGVGLFTNYDTVIPKFVRMGLNGEDLTVYGDGSSTRDFVHVEDIARALILALKSKAKGSEVYNVGGETMEIGVLAKRIVDSLRKSTGKEVCIVNQPPRAGETKEFSYNLEKIRKGLGYKPSWGIPAGIEQIIKFRLEQLGS